MRHVRWIGLAGLGFVLASVACSEPDFVGQASDVSATEKKEGTTETKDEECAEGEEAVVDEKAAQAPAAKEDSSKREACCEIKNVAHCIAEGEVPAKAQSAMNKCPSGGLCVPDSLAAGKATVACKGALGDGVCLSECVKKVSDNKDLLDRANCAEGELCAPCIDPRDGKESGACKISEYLKEAGIGGGAAAPKKTCVKKASTKEATPAKEGEKTTPAPEGASACCSGKGKCLPKTVVPEDNHENLEAKECAEEKLCVPIENIDRANFKPTPCTGEAVTGEYEGVCLSNCLVFSFVEKTVSDQGSCDKDHRCMPCKMPLVGTATGAPGCGGK